MILPLSLFLILSLLQYCSPFTPTTLTPRSGNGKSTSLKSGTNIDRHKFLTSIVTVTAAGSSALLLPTQPAYARGRATLEYALDRYYPRIEAGGVFYATDLKKAIERNDWQAIKVCVFVNTIERSSILLLLMKYER